MRKNRFALALLLTLSLAFALSGLSQQTSDDTATDLVCGMTVKKSEAKATLDYKGTTYYFCNAGCKDAFAKDPERYLQKKDESAPAKTGPCPNCRQGMQPQAGPHARMGGKCPMMQTSHQHGQMAGPAAGMNCPLMSKDVEKKAENLADGAAIKITSKDPEMVKKIQEHVQKMGAGAGCCCMGQPQAQEKK